MLDHWLTPVQDESLFQLVEEHPECLGNPLLENQSSTEAIKVALIGTGAPETMAIRKQLYQLSAPFRPSLVADLGNLRRTDPEFVIPLLREIQESEIIPVILAPDLNFMYTMFRGQSDVQEKLNISLFAAQLDAEAKGKMLTGQLEELLNHKDLSHFSLLGGQTHFIPNSLHQWLRVKHFEQLRLGAIRGSLHHAEPLIRHADLVGFHLGALKQIEAPAQSPVSPSGFFSEEACQLVRYAGMSDKLRAFGFFGFDPDNDILEQSAAVIAQMIWYFLDGVTHRKNDFPASKKNLVEYLVQSKEWHSPLVFWKSNKSGRWWLQLPGGSEIPGRHHLLPCSYEEYVSCTNDDIPDRLAQLMHR